MPRHPAVRRPIRLERLEDRTLLAVMIQFDYSWDPNSMFDNPEPRAALEAAARNVASYLETSLNAYTFSNGRYLLAVDPRTGQRLRRDHVTIPADTLVIRVGGRELPGSQLGVASRDSFGYDHGLAVYPRNEAFGTGGTIAFDTVGTDWYFGMSGSVPDGKTDFYSVAVHELGHILGIGSSLKWNSLVSDGFFRGASAMQRYGGPVPTDQEVNHFAEGVRDPQAGEAALDPTIGSGIRKQFTPLDFAALADLGWSVTYDPNAQRHLGDVISPRAINEGGFNHVVGGDFNHDHCDDLLFLDQSTGQNRWFFGRPDGTFDFKQDLIGRGSINQYDNVVAGDFDGDGYTDLLGHAKASGANRWFFSQPHDTFEQQDDRIPPGLLDGFDHVVAGDFDGDGDDDLLFHNLEGGNRWYFSLPNGTLRREDERIPRGLLDGFDHVVAGDFDGDGDDDLLFHNLEGGNRWYFSLPDGTLRREDERIPRGLIDGVEHVGVGDFDGNGREDLLFHSINDGGNRWYFSLADDTLRREDTRVNRAAIDGIYNHLVVGDFNGDGAADGFFHAQTLGYNVLVPGIPQAPMAPVITGFSDDTGVLGDNLTHATALTLRGTAADAGLTVRVYDHSTLLGTTSTGAGGLWTFTTGTLSVGSHLFRAVVVSAAGLVSPDSAVFPILIDRTAPMVLSSVRADANPVNTGSVHYLVTFIPHYS